MADDANERNLPRELLSIVVDDEIGGRERARLRELFVLLGRRPSQTAALTTLMLEHNDGLTATRAALQHLDLAEGDTTTRIDEVDTSVMWILGPLAAGGIGVFAVGAVGAIATVGTGGATLIALGGIAMLGGSTRGIVRVLRERSDLQNDQAAMKTLAARLKACEADLLRRFHGDNGEG
jgi:hypothetical protein